MQRPDRTVAFFACVIRCRLRTGPSLVWIKDASWVIFGWQNGAGLRRQKTVVPIIKFWQQCEWLTAAFCCQRVLTVMTVEHSSSANKVRILLTVFYSTLTKRASWRELGFLRWLCRFFIQCFTILYNLTCDTWAITLTAYDALLSRILVLGSF